MVKPLEQGWSWPLWSQIKQGDWHKERLEWIQRFESFNKEHFGKIKGLVEPTFDEGSKVLLSPEFKELVQEGIQKGFLCMNSTQIDAPQNQLVDLTITFDYNLHARTQQK